MHSAINLARKNVGVDILSLNVNLNKMAQYWASHLVNTSEIQPHEDIRKLRLGESITSIWHEFDKKPNAGEVVNEWLCSGRFHNRTHHVQLAANYTQLVWRSTKEVGCAFCHNPIDHRTIVVCYFYPAGNVQGQFERNIPKTGEADDGRLNAGYYGLDPGSKLQIDQFKSNLTD